MKRSDMSLEGKVALVTGASRGIGEAAALTLAAHGAELILVSRKIDSLKEVENRIVSGGGKACSIACHTGKMDMIRQLFKEVEDRFGRLDILLNNAATNPYFGGVLQATEEAWDKTVDVNFKGYFFMSQFAANLMLKSGGGSIINVASINAVRPAPMQGIYSMTKAGVVSMTKTFAKELAPFHVRVNAVLPGLTDTKFASAMTKNDELMEKVILPTIPMGRAALPEEMAGAILYLASDASSYTTGSSIVVDGGSLA